MSNCRSVHLHRVLHIVSHYFAVLSALISVCAISFAVSNCGLSNLSFTSLVQSLMVGTPGDSQYVCVCVIALVVYLQNRGGVGRTPGTFISGNQYYPTTRRSPKSKWCQIKLCHIKRGKYVLNSSYKSYWSMITLQSSKMFSLSAAINYIGSCWF